MGGRTTEGRLQMVEGLFEGGRAHVLEGGCGRHLKEKL